MGITSQLSWRRYKDLPIRPQGIPVLIPDDNGDVTLFNCELFCRVRIGVTQANESIMCQHEKRFSRFTELKKHLHQEHQLSVQTARNPNTATLIATIAFYDSIMRTYDASGEQGGHRSERRQRQRRKRSSRFTEISTVDEEQALPHIDRTEPSQTLSLATALNFDEVHNAVMQTSKPKTLTVRTYENRTELIYEL